MSTLQSLSVKDIEIKWSAKQVVNYLDTVYELETGKHFDSILLNQWGFLIRVESSSLQFMSTLQRQFANFVEFRTFLEPDIVIRAVAVNSILDFPAETDYIDYSREDHLLLVAPFFVCRFNEGMDYIQMVVESEPETFLLSAMRAIAPHIAKKKKGTLLHASAIAYADKLYAFIGESGAGKSTVVKMLSRYNILSDEAVMVQRDDVGKIMGWGTPYGREHGGANKCVPIGYCFFLVQDTSTYLRLLQPSEAVTRLMSNLWCINNVGRLALGALDLSIRISQQIPCYELHFELSDRFWHEISRLDKINYTYQE